jgi:hypothetical protein
VLANINKLNRSLEGVIAVSIVLSGRDDKELMVLVCRLAMNSARSKRYGHNLRT